MRTISAMAVSNVSQQWVLIGDTYSVLLLHRSCCQQKDDAAFAPGMHVNQAKYI